MNDKLYVIYFDGIMFKDGSKKGGFISKSHAELVVGHECRRVGRLMHREGKDNGCWYEIGELGKQEWFDKARERFEIKEFVQNK